MSLFRKPTLESEREFEKKLILSQKERYLSTDVLEKVATDSAYERKVTLIEDALGKVEGWVLDIGANTSGEAEYLASKGYQIIASDINEFALSISKERSQKYRQKTPYYCATDASSLALMSNTINFVIVFEALHHLVSPIESLLSVSRVLSPGGRVFLLEPHKFNPYRRLAEVRDYFKGTIEKSFSVTELKELLQSAGLILVSVERHVLPPSEKKMENITLLQRLLRRFYYSVSQKFPSVFGSILVMAKKPGLFKDNHTNIPYEKLLMCPLCNSDVKIWQQQVICSNKKCRLKYPVYHGVPVLIADEAQQSTDAEWEATFNKEII